jgi:hypothetical protein
MQFSTKRLNDEKNMIFYLVFKGFNDKRNFKFKSTFSVFIRLYEQSDLNLKIKNKEEFSFIHGKILEISHIEHLMNTNFIKLPLNTAV